MPLPNEDEDSVTVEVHHRDEWGRETKVKVRMPVDEFIEVVDAVTERMVDNTYLPPPR